jgi:hypothetical protein
MSKARARSAMSWPVGPNFAKSKSIESTRGYRDRIIDDAIPTASLPGSRVERQQGGLGDTAEVTLSFGLFRGLLGAHCSTLAKVRRLRMVVDDL